LRARYERGEHSKTSAYIVRIRKGAHKPREKHRLSKDLKRPSLPLGLIFSTETAYNYIKNKHQS
jgi:hypothetical protein